VKLFKRLLFLTSFSIIVGLVCGYLVNFLVPKEIHFIGFSNIGIGGTCDPPALYNANGMNTSNGDDLYSVPMYVIDPENISRFLNISHDSFCFTYPDQVPIELLGLGQTYFPLEIKIDIPKWMRPGEEKFLRMKVGISDQIETESTYQFISLKQNDPIEVSFKFNATNIGFTPTEAVKKSFSMNKPLQLEWSISPKEFAKGTQQITISMESQLISVWPNEDSIARFHVQLEVRNLFGINSFHGRIIGTAVTFLIGLPSLLKIVHELRNSKKPYQRRKRSGRRR